jgi:hypothetical protein
MSPFGRNKVEHGQDQQSDQPSAPGDSNPQLDAEVARLQGLTLVQLASEVMAKGFSADYDPTADGSDVPGIADDFFPRPDFTLRDSTVKAQVHKAQAEAQPGTPEHQLLVLADLVAEGVQILEHASLIRLKTNYDGQVFNAGYVATRLGHAALQQNAVDKVLAGGSL